MTRRDGTELVLLAALWGASFLFMRTGAPEFGPVPLVFVRVTGACALLLPLLAWQRDQPALRQHWRPLLVVGISNSALPFVLFTLAALVLDVGLSGIFNATAPLWGALIAWLWLHDRPSPLRALGLAIGFAGVLGLGWDRASFRPGEHGVSPTVGIVACIAATLCYGFSVNYTRKRLLGVPPMAVAAGSQLAAALVTLLPALWLWPAAPPSSAAWGAAAVLALVCTGLAYVVLSPDRPRRPGTGDAVTFLFAPAIAWARSSCASLDMLLVRSRIVGHRTGRDRQARAALTIPDGRHQPQIRSAAAMFMLAATAPVDRGCRLSPPRSRPAIVLPPGRPARGTSRKAGCHATCSAVKARRLNRPPRRRFDFHSRYPALRLHPGGASSAASSASTPNTCAPGALSTMSHLPDPSWPRLCQRSLCRKQRSADCTPTAPGLCEPAACSAVGKVETLPAAGLRWTA
jgi:drug/metabolite transporter (DMT)-like permease